MSKFRKHTRRDGTVEYINVNYDALIAQAEATPPEPAIEITPEQMAEDNMRSLRRDRDRKLAETDWTQLPDVPEETREAYREYRQALRDITINNTDPTTADWPEKP